MAEVQIPSVVLSGEVLGLDRESEAWKALTKKVREACETCGCFVLEYEKISMELQEELFKTCKEMFDLPEEKKSQYKRPGRYLVNNPSIPLYESFGVDRKDVQTFQKLMWPEGKPGFCEVVNSINEKMLELHLLLLRMIFESYGLGEYYKSKELDDNIICNFRAMRYRVPKGNEEGTGLASHIDKNIISILCQNSVQGLELLTKEGNWIPVTFPKGALVVIVGDGLQAWSNGRLHPGRHRVMMGSDKERYSCGYFSLPKDGVTIEVPQELVDKEHPLQYRQFVYSEYLATNNFSADALNVYAGI